MKNVTTAKQKINTSKIDFANYDQISKCLDAAFETENIVLIDVTIKELEPAKNLVEAWLNKQMGLIGDCWQSNSKFCLIRKYQLEIFDEKIGKVNGGNLCYSEYFWKTVRETELFVLIEYFLNCHSKTSMDADEIVDYMCEFIDDQYNQDEENGQAIDLNLISPSYVEYKNAFNELPY